MTSVTWQWPAPAAWKWKTCLKQVCSCWAQLDLSEVFSVQESQWCVAETMGRYRSWANCWSRWWEWPALLLSNLTSHVGTDQDCTACLVLSWWASITTVSLCIHRYTVQYQIIASPAECLGWHLCAVSYSFREHGHPYGLIEHKYQKT